MQPLRRFVSRLGALFARRRLDLELDEEMRTHIDLATQANIEAGMNPDEARFVALRRFGSRNSPKELCREQRGFEWLHTFTQDLRFGLRLWRKQPGLFALALVALTLGIGLVTFSLSAINCVFFSTLPLPDADRLVYTSASLSDFRKISEQQKTFAALSGFGEGSANFRAANAPSRRAVCAIGANLLDVTQAKPLLGRGFLPEEEKPGAKPVALIGYDLWQQEFDGKPAAVGSMIHLDGQPRTVVGVMPQGFKFPINNNLWIPAEPGSALMTGWGFMFGRLRTGATIAEARAELDVIVQRNAASAQNAQTAEPRIQVGPYTRNAEMKGAYGPGPAMWAMLVVTLLVLFVACANVSGLMLAEAFKRAPEWAVRSALGATRRRVVRQMLIENLIVAAAGAGCALLLLGWLYHWADGWLSANSPTLGDAPYWIRLKIDGRLLLSILGLVVLATVAAGLPPALQATKRDVHDLLKSGTGGAVGPRTGRFAWFLTTVQIAFSVAVLTQSVILMNYSLRLRQNHLPFDPASVLTARISLPTSADPHLFFKQLTQNLAHLPGVESVALSSGALGFGGYMSQISIEGKAYPRPQDHPYAGSQVVSDNYFSTLNIPMTRGRSFNPADEPGSLPVALVNTTFARMFLNPANPLGQRIREGTNQWLTVVGCVPDLHFDPSEGEPAPVYFTPQSQQPSASMVVLLRGLGAPLDWAAPLRAEVNHLQPDLGLDLPVTMQTLIDHQIIGYYLASGLLAVCGGAALFLAVLGILGLITLSVNQRKREIGVRLALGATRLRIVGEFMGRAAWQIAGGLSLGAVLAFGLNQALDHAIADYPTAGNAALLLAGSVCVLAALCAGAVFIPALRGARVDPMKALRYE